MYEGPRQTKRLRRKTLSGAADTAVLLAQPAIRDSRAALPNNVKNACVGTQRSPGTAPEGSIRILTAELGA